MLKRKVTKCKDVEVGHAFQVIVGNKWVLAEVTERVTPIGRSGYQCGKVKFQLKSVESGKVIPKLFDASKLH